MAKKLSQLITVREAAKRASFTEEYVRRLLRERWVTGEKIVSVWMVHERSFNDYLKSARARQSAVDSHVS